MNGWQEGRFVAEQISELVRREGKRYSDFAVFYRTHAQSRALEEALLEKYIPYRIIGARRFFERKEIKDILAYLRLSRNPSDYLSFRRIINIPKRGIGEKTLEKIEAKAREKGMPVLEVLADPAAVEGVNKKTAQSLQEFYGMLQYFSSLDDGGLSLADILEEIINVAAYLPEIKESDPASFEARLENLEELKSLAVEFEKNGGQGADEFLAQLALVQENDETEDADAVTLMTFHGAKGLEYPVVFMTGLEEGVFPSYRCETAEQMEEERRLCYVGITRAMESLYLSHAVLRIINGYERSNPPSRFLQEIPRELIIMPGQETHAGNDVQPGDRVRHRKFGPGTVVRLIEEEQVAVIDFDQAGTRMLRTDLAPLEKIG